MKNIYFVFIKRKKEFIPSSKRDEVPEIRESGKTIRNETLLSTM